jgi:hypothetical protein
MTDLELKEKMELYVKEFEEKTGASVIYITKSGSKLYGTDNEFSDTDFKGLFIPSKESVLLKQDINSYTRDTNTKKEKNSTEDIDFTIHSLYAFFNQLSKSETGAVDVLFSMFREDTIMFQDKEIIDKIRKEYKVFLNKNMKSFIGYALGQTKKFGIKGARYDELDKFIDFTKMIPDYLEGAKLGTLFTGIKEYISTNKLQYIKFVMAPGPRVQGGRQDDIEYVSVLGKLFSATVTIDYFIDRVTKLYDQFGNRTKTVAQTASKTDFKALSHSLRIAEEVKELLQTEFIKFPLENADYIREIKEGKHDTQEVIDQVSDVLDEVDILLLESKLPEETDNEILDVFLLKLLNIKWDERKYI